MKKKLYIDTETTGLSSAFHGIREIGCIIEIDGKEVDKFVLYINPSSYNKEVAYDDYALELSNKTLNELIGYPDSKNQFKVFTNILNKYIDTNDKKDKFQISGFNTSFDTGFLNAWFSDNWSKEYSSYFSYSEIDILAFARSLTDRGCFTVLNHKLTTLCEHFNIPLNAHNALDDIIATKKLYEVLTDKFIAKRQNDEIKHLKARHQKQCQKLSKENETLRYQVDKCTIEIEDTLKRLEEIEKIIDCSSETEED